MKKLILPLLVAIFTAVQTFAYDFSAVSPSGHTLYYEYISKSDKTVRVTFELWNGTDAPYNTTPSGEITIPSTVTYEETTYSVTEIASYAFFGCNKITSVTIQEGITIIMDDAFDECSKLQSLYLPNSLKTLKSWVFRACEKLKNIELPNSLSTIDASCFSGCKSLETITLPSLIKTIENYTFSGCENLTSITFPNGLLQIKEGAFYNCKNLSSITLPNSLTKIGKNAFTGIGDVFSISIPASVTEIGEGAFSSYIKYFFLNSTIPPSIYGTIFPNVAQIFVPCDALENYQNDEDWAQYKDYLKTASHKFFISSSNKNYGTVSVVTENSCDDEFTLVLTATPTYDNYQFGGWSDGNKENPRTITVTKDTSFTALFGEKPQINNLQQVNPICTSATGSFSFEVTNGVAPYTILWNDGITNNPRNNMVAGRYRVVVEDALGFTSDTVDVVLTSQENNSMPQATISSIDPICESATGALSTTVSGGTEPYSYTWKKQEITEETVWNFEENMNSVENGLDGTATLYAATNFNQTDIFESFALTPTAGGVSGNAINVQIGTDSLATFKIELPFRNDYTPIYGTGENAAVYEQYYDQFNIATNTYGISFYHKGSSLYLYALDNNLERSNKFNIPFHLDWTQVIVPWSELTKEDIVAIVFSAKEFEYRKSYDFGIDEVSILMYDKADVYSSDQDLNNLSAGKYTVTVTDATGCEDTRSVILNKDFSRILNSVYLESLDPICEKENGTILAIVDEEHSPYTFLWDDGNTSQNRSNLGEGDYSVTISDADGCNVSLSVTLEKNYNDLPEYEVFKREPICTSSTGEIAVQSDVPYNFDWKEATWFPVANFEKGVLTWFGSAVKPFNDSEIFTYSTTDVSQSGVVNDGANGTGKSYLLKATSITIGNYLGYNNAGFVMPLYGSYTFDEKFSKSLGVSFYHKGDACGVGLTDSYDVKTVPAHSEWTLVTIYWDEDLGIKMGEQEIKEIQWVFRHEFSNKSDIEFQIDEVSLLINHENAEVFSNNIKNLSSGDYILTATDEMGCATSKVVSLRVNETNKPVITKEFSNAICGHDVGEITISYKKGSGTIQYSWEDFDAMTLTRNNLAPGTYIFNIHDEYGCTASDTTEIVYESFKYQPEIALVTVSQESSANLVVWQKEETQAIDFYSIYRETSSANDYEKIADVPFNHTSIYLDENTDSQTKAYRYKISATDNCGQESPLSDNHKTINATASLGVGGVVNLIWDGYEGFEFSTYSIYRITKDDKNPVQPIDEVPSTNWTYVDKNAPENTLAYYVAVKLPKTIDVNEPFVKAESGPFVLAISNIAEIESQGGTGISTVDGISVNVYGTNNAIVIENTGENQITICNAMGQTIVRAKGMNETKRSFNVENGIYIVIVGNKAFRVVVE